MSSEKHIETVQEKVRGNEDELCNMQISKIALACTVYQLYYIIAETLLFFSNQETIAARKL